MPTAALTHDAAGNIITDVRGANVYSYAYDAANRLSEVSKDGVLQASYVYNGFGQLAARTLTAATGLPGTVHYFYDGDGHLIAEADAATGAIVREYLWLDDLPVAVVNGTSLYHVVTDHLYRPIAMFDDAGTEVWSAVWEPFGALHSVTGALTLDARFPGQWYQLETGLHYNWHRHYDPTLGRYTQPDPLGMPDGPNRYAYARNNPVMNVDPDGQRLKGGARQTNCKGLPLLRGKDIHKLFETLARSSSPVELEFNKGTSIFGGKPDVFAPTTGNVWELKPTTFGDGWMYDTALNQINSYTAQSNSTWWKPGSWNDLFPDTIIATIRHPYYGTVVFEPDDPNTTGLIFYSCEPPPPACYQ
jgi:RHS repeat-associated protein